jgi:hypothetical protein
MFPRALLRPGGWVGNEKSPTMAVVVEETSSLRRAMVMDPPWSLQELPPFSASVCRPPSLNYIIAVTERDSRLGRWVLSIASPRVSPARIPWIPWHRLGLSATPMSWVSAAHND